jgi:hypothetical protein
VQMAWFDLFAQHSVDLVLQGHDHTYERTHAMRGSTVVDDSGTYRTDTGTVYVVVGNGGATQEPFKPLQPEWSAFRTASVIGTLRVDVDPFGPRGMTRLVLGEFAAKDGRSVERGIVLERPPRHGRGRAAAAREETNPLAPHPAAPPAAGVASPAASAASTPLHQVAAASCHDGVARSGRHRRARRRRRRGDDRSRGPAARARRRRPAGLVSPWSSGAG